MAGYSCLLRLKIVRQHGKLFLSLGSLLLLSFTLAGCFSALSIIGIRRSADLLRWKFETNNAIRCAPVLADDGTIYVGSGDHYLYALNSDGSLKWKFETGERVDSSPAVAADGTIYVGSWDNYLYALNPDGSLKWKFKTGGWVRSSPAIGAGGIIYMGSWDHFLYAVKPDGSLAWKFKTGDKVDSSPAIGVDGTIYVGSWDHCLYALNPDGSLKWRFQTADLVKSSPAIGADGTIYVGSDDHYLYALNPDGSLKWKFETGDWVRSSPAVTVDGTIYVGSDDRYLYALNPDGSLKWKFETGGWVRSSPAVGADSVVYVGSADHHLYALNPTGTLKWKFETGAKVGSSPAIAADSAVYVGSDDHYLYDIKSSSSLRWIFKPIAWVYSSSFPKNSRTTHVGSDNRDLYAIADLNGSLVRSSWPKFHRDQFNGGFIGKTTYTCFTTEKAAPLLSSTGKTITRLPIATSITIVKAGKNYAYVQVGDNLKGWIKNGTFSPEKPDIARPLIRIIEKNFQEPYLYLKGVAYDDKAIAAVAFAGKNLPRADFEVEHTNYGDVYPFEARLLIMPGTKKILRARDHSGKVTELPLRIEGRPVSYIPELTQLVTTKAANLRSGPSLQAKVLKTVPPGTQLLALGHKKGWYILEGGSWIYRSVVKKIELPQTSTPGAITIAEAAQVPTPPDVPALSDVDVKIPSTHQKRPYDVALIIANAKYQSQDVPPVKYALRDAHAMRDYLVKTLGFKKENILYVENATLAKMRELLGSENNPKGRLYNFLRPGRGTVFVYYVGHGAPDLVNKEAYFVPVDCAPNFVAQNGYPLSLFYDNLNRLPARQITVVIDACFSGGYSEGMLIRQASPIYLSVEQPQVPKKALLFTAANGDQIASWYPGKGHSLFTYFFLKGLQGEADLDGNGSILAGEMAQYLKDNVPYLAGRLFNRDQNPVFEGNPESVLARLK